MFILRVWEFCCVPHVCLPEEGMKAPGTGIKEVCEPSFGCLELNLCLLQEQQVLLTPEPPLQAPQLSLKAASILLNKAENKTRK